MVTKGGRVHVKQQLRTVAWRVLTESNSETNLTIWANRPDLRNVDRQPLFSTFSHVHKMYQNAGPGKKRQWTREVLQVLQLGGKCVSDWTVQ